MFRKFVKKLIPTSLFRQIEPFGHLCETILMNVLLGFPARGLKVIGVTGTDGKTTTSFYVYTMLKSAGYKVGLQTTVAYGADKVIANPTHMTVVNAHDWLRRVKQMRAEGVEWLVFETTSHALAQRRVWGVPYVMGVWTNLHPEHMDYYWTRTFDLYKAAKLRLFKMVAANQKGYQLGVLNADDSNVAAFLQEVPKSLTYGIENGELRATRITTTGRGSDYVATYKQRSFKIHTSLPARFNVYNSLAAIGVGIALGLDDVQIERGIAELKSVAGRMNQVEAGQDFNLVIDFAHTPNAFTNVFRDLRPLTSGRLIAVFGATGNRDKAKRPQMGRIAASLCDLLIITEDDDGTEDGLAIMDEVAAGAEKAGKRRGKTMLLIHDRKQAITEAVNQALPGDTVVLLGIGHQTTLNTNQGEVSWSEDKVAREAIAAKLAETPAKAKSTKSRRAV